MSPNATYQIIITKRRYGHETVEFECASDLQRVEEIKRAWSRIAKSIRVFKLDEALSEDAGPWRTIDESKANAHLFTA
jgi:hypothetical protein